MNDEDFEEARLLMPHLGYQRLPFLISSRRQSVHPSDTPPRLEFDVCLLGGLDLEEKIQGDTRIRYISAIPRMPVMRSWRGILSESTTSHFFFSILYHYFS